jgi:endogenous inhibitor of DNA gyrase (YacG/DUF329 family)
VTATIGTRCCLTCGRPFTVPANNPHKRYCSSRCRVAHWHHRRDPARPCSAQAGAAAANGVTNDVPGTNAVTNAAPPTSDCPHCHQPVAVITLLVTPAAAHVPVPATGP